MVSLEQCIYNKYLRVTEDKYLTLVVGNEVFDIDTFMLNESEMGDVRCALARAPAVMVRDFGVEGE